MSISKYAFLAVVACASPALAADITLDSNPVSGLSVTVPEGFHVTTSGNCSLQQIPIPTPKGVSPEEPQCFVTMEKDEVTNPATVTTAPAVTQLNQKFYFNWSGDKLPESLKLESTPSAGVLLFPDAAPIKPAVTPDVPSVTSSDRLGALETQPQIFVVPTVSEPVPDLPASPIPVVEKEILPAPQVAFLAPPFTPEGIYQECSLKPYFFTQNQANIAYARFKDEVGYNASRIAGYWYVGWYSHACYVMKTY